MSLNINEIITLFDSDFDAIKDMILNTTVFSFEPEEEECKTIESGLRKLAECENKNACAIYAIVTAYDNCCNCFSKSFATEQIFKTKSVENYHNILDEEFRDVVDEEYYSFLYSAPAIWLMEYVVEHDK